VSLPGLHWCEVVDTLVEMFGVEPVDPLEGLSLDVLDVIPRSVDSGQLGLVEPDLRLGEGVVVAVALALAH
jgi:hypothetical protein